MKKQIYNIQITNNKFIVTYDQFPYERDIIPYNESTKKMLINTLKAESKILNIKKELLKSGKVLIIALNILSIFGTIFSLVLFNDVLLKIAMSFAFLEISIILIFVTLGIDCSIKELKNKFNYDDLLKAERHYLKKKKIIDFKKYRENIMQSNVLNYSKNQSPRTLNRDLETKIIKFKQK